jgi:hypothetical protein
MADRYVRNGGGNYNATGTWELTPGGGESVAVPTSSDDVKTTATSGNLTVTAAAAAKTWDFTNYTGTLTINTSQTATVSGSITWGSGMTLAGDGTLTLGATATLTSNGKAMPFTFNIGNSTLTLTLADDANSDGPCSIGNGNTQTINGNKWYCSGNFTILGRCQGTTEFVLDGTGTLTGTSNLARYISSPLTINTAGTITMAAQSINLGGTFTLTAGTLVTTGSSVTISASTSLVGSFPSFNNMLITAASTLTIDNALTITGTLTTAASLTLSGNYAVTIGTVSVTGTATFTRVNSLTVTEWYVNPGITSTIAGAYDQTVDTLTVDRGGTLTFPINQTLTVSTRIDVCGSSKATTTVKSSSASTAFTLTYNGTSANMNIDSATFTDVTATATLYNHNGGTLTRCSGITNHSFNPGDYSSPGAANTKTGVSYTYEGATVNGTYDGSDRWTDPGEVNVRSATAYKANSTSNNKTGSCAVPIASNVLAGVAVDATTGTFDEAARNTDPGISNVRTGQAYKIANASKTGTCAVPVAGNVLSGVAVDATTGTFDEAARNTDPGESNVIFGTSYKIQNASKIGTFNESARNSDPGEASVAYGVTYKILNVSKTGTFDPGGAVYTDPGVANVKDGTAYTFNDLPKVGEYDPIVDPDDVTAATETTVTFPPTAFPPYSDPPTAADYVHAVLSAEMP